MNYNLANNEQILYDKYDNYSTNFLLEFNAEDVGTIRHTAQRDGPLESEEQHESWRSFICSAEKDPQVVCEVARIMIRPSHRGTRASLALGRAA